jgi:hypothetical protein
MVAPKRGVGGRALMQRSVRTMRVVVLHKLTQHCGEVARSGDQQVIEAFAPQRAAARVNGQVEVSSGGQLKVPTPWE